MDIEYSEWEAFENILTTTILHQVKQLGLEVHILGGLEKIGNLTAKSFEYYFDILYGIEKYGFRKFSSHINPNGVNIAKHHRLPPLCLLEFVYININFLDQN